MRRTRPSGRSGKAYARIPQETALVSPFSCKTPGTSFGLHVGRVRLVETVAGRGQSEPFAEHPPPRQTAPVGRIRSTGCVSNKKVGLRWLQ